jgi:hypothetical protein
MAMLTVRNVSDERSTGALRVLQRVRNKAPARPVSFE